MTDAAATTSPSESAFRSSVRAEITRALTSGIPSEEIHRQIVAWTEATSLNSLRAMRADLRAATTFQQKYGAATLPISPAQLHLLLDELSRSGRMKSTISRLVASMAKLHQLAKLPTCVDEIVRYKLKQIRRVDSRPVRQARGLRLKGEIRDFTADAPLPLSLLGLLSSIPDGLGGLRDRALISMAYDGGLRRSEIVRIQVGDVERIPNGEASLFIPRSKTDQDGDGARAWMSERSVAYLDEWLQLSQIDDGFVFRSLSFRVGERGHLSEAAVSHILKNRLNAYLLELESEGRVTSAEREAIVKASSSHSMRVGCDQDLFSAGLDIGAIMQSLRWSNPKQPLAYARHLAPASSKLAALMRQANKASD